MKPLDVDLDAIMEDMGRAGKYQIKHFLWTLLPVILCSLHATTYIFTTDDVSYRCKVPECDGNVKEFEPSWMYNAIPSGDKCARYSGNSSRGVGLGVAEEGESCSADSFDKRNKVRCGEYVFKVENTFIEEMNIPCQDWKRTLVGTAHSIGTLIALPIVGVFSDRFGRRQALIVSSMMDGAFGLAKSFAVNYPMFLTLEVLEPVFGYGVYTSAYILALELLTPSTRVIGGALVSTYFSIGQILLGFIAWGFPYWRTFLRVIYAPSFMLFAFYWLSDESIRWQLSKRRYGEAMNSLKNIAAANGGTISDKVLENLQYNLNNTEKIEQNISVTRKEAVEKEVPAWRLVLSSKILILRVLKVSVWWVTCTFCIYGLSINSTILPGNKYVNFILSSAAEIPSQFVGYYGLTYFGRKKTVFVSFLGGGLCLLTVSFTPKGLETLSLIAYLLGKFFVVMAIGAVYLYTSELFPTPLRHTLLAVCSMIGRIGSILAPQTLLLIVYMKQLPALLFASTCLISAALMLGSPETLNLKLPETVEEAENISKSKKDTDTHL